MSLMTWTRTAVASQALVDTGLAGKGVLVTGASGGIGSACARAFAAEGARVVVHYHRGGSAREAVAAEIGGAAALQADLTDRGRRSTRLFEDARRRSAGRRLRGGRRRVAVARTCRSGSCRSSAGSDAARRT